MTDKEIVYNSLIPELSVSNIDISKKFYLDLGFEIRYERKENKFCFLQLEGNQIMIEENNDNWNIGKLEHPYGRGINLSMTVSNIEKMYEILKEKNIKFFLDLEIHEYRIDPAKIKKYVDKLKEKDIEILTIKDLGINLKPEETGKNAIENAYIKAKTYYDKTKIISIGMDNNLYIEGLPEEKQPGTHVRRINGKELNDEEMIEYYSKLVNEYGGKLTAKWVYGMVIYDGKETNEYSCRRGHFYFIDKP